MKGNRLHNKYNTPLKPHNKQTNHSVSHGTPNCLFLFTYCIYNSAEKKNSQGVYTGASPNFNITKQPYKQS